MGNRDNLKLDIMKNSNKTTIKIKNVQLEKELYEAWCLANNDAGVIQQENGNISVMLQIEN